MTVPGGSVTEYLVTGVVERVETARVLATTSQHAVEIFRSIQWSRGATDSRVTKVEVAP